MLKQRIPSYSRASKSRAYCRVNGEWISLGRFNSQASREKYDSLIAEWLAHGRTLPSTEPEQVTMSRLLLAFWKHAETYYAGSSELHKYRQLLGMLRKGYGSRPVEDFGPRALIALREQLIDKDRCRSQINGDIGRIKRVFKWGVQSELVPASVYDALRCVEGLRYGKSAAKESTPVQPVPEEHIRAAGEHLPDEIAAMLKLQLLTACRPGEIVLLRPMDLDTTGKVWLFRPRFHKNTHRQRERIVYVGPGAQTVLGPFLVSCPTDQYVFSPKRVLQRMAEKAPTHRRKDQKPNRKKTTRVVRERYDVGSYRRCVTRVCEAHGIPAFSLHQIRHTAATVIRREHGLEAAQLMCGHARADVTQLYAETNAAKALEVAAQIG